MLINRQFAKAVVIQHDIILHVAQAWSTVLVFGDMFAKSCGMLQGLLLMNVGKHASEASIVWHCRATYIYSITCSNGKVYVGLSTNPHRRFQQHSRHPPALMKADAHIHQPWDQHFQLEILKEVDDDAANDAERYYISVLHSKAPQGYNKLKGSCTSSVLEAVPGRPDWFLMCAAPPMLYHLC